MSSIIKAIETHYDGHRFRSRLEARWAVFFKALDIHYRYEPQGFETPAGPYLPDFHLPETQTWVEVKGVLTEQTLDRLRSIVAGNALPEIDRSFHTPRGLLLLGDVPQPDGKQPVHPIIQRGGEEHGHAIWLTGFGPGGLEPSLDSSPPVEEWENDSIVSSGRVFLQQTLHWRVAEAYRKARFARFEHGERP